MATFSTAYTKPNLLIGAQLGFPEEQTTNPSEWLTSTRLSTFVFREWPLSHHELLLPPPLRNSILSSNITSNWTTPSNDSAMGAGAGVGDRDGRSLDELNEVELLQLCRQDPECWNAYIESILQRQPSRAPELILVSTIYVFTLLIGLVCNRVYETL